MPTDSNLDPTSLEQALFISPVSYHGRSDGIATYFAMRQLYLERSSKNIFVKYLSFSFKIIKEVRKNPPRLIILMQPPAPYLWLVHYICKIYDIPLVGDLHTGFFNDPKWSWGSNTGLRLLRQRGLAIVTNSDLGEICAKHKCDFVVIHDQITTWLSPHPDKTEEHLLNNLSKNFVLCPLSFGNDEPINNLISAAKLTPQIQYVFTGNPSKKTVKSAPSNVTFSGFVEYSELKNLYHRAGAVVALTTREATMQRAGYEALSAGKALITSRHRVLYNYFSRGTLFVDNSANEIAEAVEFLQENQKLFEKEMRLLRSEKLDLQTNEIEDLKARLMLLMRAN